MGFGYLMTYGDLPFGNKFKYNYEYCSHSKVEFSWNTMISYWLLRRKGERSCWRNGNVKGLMDSGSETVSLKVSHQQGWVLFIIRETEAMRIHPGLWGAGPSCPRGWGNISNMTFAGVRRSSHTQPPSRHTERGERRGGNKQYSLDDEEIESRQSFWGNFVLVGQNILTIIQYFILYMYSFLFFIFFFLQISFGCSGLGGGGDYSSVYFKCK